jgi:serine kinase of HPr protein (carbohydrate metabolism regulator)
MVTSLNTSRFYSVISPFLDLHFAPTMRAHGDLVDVYGMGVLITGDSGVGKSECALELVERSHRLIADDVVVIKRPNATTLIGLSNAMLRHHIEVRGLGIMDVEALFGIGAVRPQAQIDLIIRLEKWSPTKNYDRLGLDNHTANLLGVSVPEYTLPVKPGRNVAILTEVAALNQRLNNANKGTAKLFEQKLSEKIEENRTLLLKDKALNLAPSKPKPNVGQSSGSLQSPFPQTPGSVSGMPPVDTMNEPTQHGFRPQDGASGSDEIVRPLPDEIEISSDPLIEP